MNAFVRQLAALSALWSLCEWLSPSGGQRKMVRFAVSLLVMAALVSAVREALCRASAPEWPSMPVLAEGVESDGLTRIAVQSAANQVWRYCEGVARKAGYEAAGQALLREDGSLEKVCLRLTPSGERPPLVDAEGLRDRLARALETEPERVQILRGNDSEEGGGSSGDGP